MTDLPPAITDPDKRRTQRQLALARLSRVSVPVESAETDASASADDGERDYLATAVVHFRVRGADIPSALELAKAMFSEELERSGLFGDGAVATVLADRS